MAIDRVLASGHRTRAIEDPSAPTRVSPPARAILAPYPRSASCPACLEFATVRAGRADRWTLAAATLGYHDSGHDLDPMLCATEHFGTWLSQPDD